MTTDQTAAVTTGGTRPRRRARPRTRSAALRRLIDELTAERHRPVPPPPAPAHDPAKAREQLAQALRRPRRPRRGQR